LGEKRKAAGETLKAVTAVTEDYIAREAAKRY
jgi:hypothetical protein